MRRFIPGIIVFVVGIGVGYFVVLQRGGGGNTSTSRSVNSVIGTIDKTPVTVSSESPMVRAAALIEPSVVNIDTAGPTRTSTIDNRGQIHVRDETVKGMGSGVLISSDGYIVTNNHVVENAVLIRVTTMTDQKYQARLVGADPEADIAVIKIDGANLPVAELGDSDKLRVGEYALAVGNPLGVGTTVTHGIISATNRKNLNVGDGKVLKQAIQTDAPINRGNSGGALANLQGQLIGINTAIRSEGNGGNIGIGFAIPINAARSVLKAIIAEGQSKVKDVGQPFIGVLSDKLPNDVRAQLGLKPNEGVSIRVFAVTPADNAGLTNGTVVTAVDGVMVTGPQDIRNAVAKHKVGEQVFLTVIRGDGKREDIKVTVGRRPSVKE